MADLRDKVKTVVLVMFENRSFDHMLGHLSFEGLNTKVGGLTKPLTQYENLYQGDAYNPYKITNDAPLSFDLPHDFDFVAAQLARSPVTKKYMMTGFVEAYAQATGTIPNMQSEPMGFFPSSLVPITSFLSRTFCTCDRWFAPLPTSTQPNRTMAFFGDSQIFDTKTRLIPGSNSIFEWMNRTGLRWRVYHDGLSFFALYPDLWPHVLGPNFRDFENFHMDMMNEPANAAPQVIIVEPSYEDSPHIGSDHPNDNHAPLAVGWGEDFLRRIYEAVTANKDRWGETVMIVYYDEHGGFWDHVAPPLITYNTTGNPSHQFESLGPRIPGIIVSPFVDEGSVCNSLLDHTSVLQFLAELSTPNSPYSSTVENRKKQGIASISQALTRTSARTDRPSAPSQAIHVSTALGRSVSTAPTSDMAKSFVLAAQRLMAEEPTGVGVKYPELFQWQAAISAARR